MLAKGREHGLSTTGNSRCAQPPNEKAAREPFGAKEKDQVAKVRKILTSSPAAIPVIKIIAYNLEKTGNDDVYAVVERTLQSTFGIQKVFDKTTGGDRIVQKGSLLQIRNNSANYPPLSLEAAYCKGRNSSVGKSKSMRFQTRTMRRCFWWGFRRHTVRIIGRQTSRKWGECGGTFRN